MHPRPGAGIPPLSGRGRLRIQPRGSELEQPDRPVQVLQPVLPHVRQHEPQLLLFILDQRLGGL